MTDPSTTWQRARRPEQIAERRADILRAAAHLIDEGGIETTGLNAIARQAGLSKANLYRYFESREAILLDLTLDAFREWCEQVIRDLQDVSRDPAAATVESISHTLARRNAEQPRLGLLINALPGIIEHNISLETAIAFKGQAFEMFKQIAQTLTQALPGLDSERAMRFLWLWSIASSGAWPHCHPHPTIIEAMQHLGMASMQQSYQQTIEAFAVALLRDQLDDGGT